MTSDIGLFRIDTTTGVATHVSTVTGLPGGDNFFVDAATVSTPDNRVYLHAIYFCPSHIIGYKPSPPVPQDVQLTINGQLRGFLRANIKH